MKTITFLVVGFLAILFVTAVYAEKGPEYDQALKYYDSGNYKEAVRLFKDYVKKKPDAAAYYRIGYGLYKLGEFSEADRYFKQAYLIDPTYSPEVSGVPKKYPEKKIKKHGKRTKGKAPAEKKSTPEAAGKQSETKPSVTPEKKEPSKDAPPQKDLMVPQKKPQPQPN